MDGVDTFERLETGGFTTRNMGRLAGVCVRAGPQAVPSVRKTYQQKRVNSLTSEHDGKQSRVEAVMAQTALISCL